MADFFDRMKDGFNKNVSIVSAGSKIMVEKSKINSSIKTLEDEKRHLAEQLGNKVYSYCLANSGNDIPFSKISAEYQEITNRNEQIKSLNAKLVELDNEMNIVKNAANTPNVPQQSALEDANSVQNAGKECTCGYVNSSDAKFCAKCGSQLR